MRLLLTNAPPRISRLVAQLQAQSSHWLAWVLFVMHMNVNTVNATCKIICIFSPNIPDLVPTHKLQLSVQFHFKITIKVRTKGMIQEPAIFSNASIPYLSHSIFHTDFFLPFHTIVCPDHRVGSA